MAEKLQAQIPALETFLLEEEKSGIAVTLAESVPFSFKKSSIRGCLARVGRQHSLKTAPLLISSVAAAALARSCSATCRLSSLIFPWVSCGKSGRQEGTQNKTRGPVPP